MQGNWISRPPDLNRGNGKHQSDRNQATGRKLQVGQLDSRTGLGCLTTADPTVSLFLRISYSNRPFYYRGLCRDLGFIICFYGGSSVILSHSVPSFPNGGTAL